MIGCTFVGLDGDSLSNILKPSDPATFSEGDVVMLHSATGYTNYYYEAGGRGDDEITWRLGGTKSEPTILPGTAFWLKTKADMTLTTSGTVLMEATSIETVANQYKMASFSYPIDYTISDLTIENLSEGDVVMVHSSTGYTNYYYEAGGRGDDEITWRLGGTKADVVIPAGKAFWLKTAKDVTIAVDAPIK